MILLVRMHQIARTRIEPMVKHKAILQILILLVLTAILYSPIIPQFYHLLQDANNSHGFLVPFIALYLIWQKADILQQEQFSPSGWGLVVLISSLLLYGIGLVGGLEILPRVAMILTVIGLVYYNFGDRVFMHIWFPLLFLFFTVPAPESLLVAVSVPLKLEATKLAASILMGVGIPVLREGNMLYFANASLEVAEACSGIRSLVSFLMLGCLFAYFMRASLPRRLILVLLTIPFAFLSNLIRVTGTGVLAHFFGSGVARGFLHESSGIFTFFLGFLLVVAAYKFLDVNHE